MSKPSGHTRTEPVSLPRCDPDRGFAFRLGSSTVAHVGLSSLARLRQHNHALGEPSFLPSEHDRAVTRWR